MSKLRLLIQILTIAGLASCQENKSPYEIRNLYIETQNLPSGIKNAIEKSLENRRDTVYNYASTEGQKDSIIYKFNMAETLPKSNLLDGTRKITVLLSNEKDSIGNPLYRVELYNSEKSEWKRVWNLGNTPFRSDTIVSDAHIEQVLLSSLDIRYWKGLP